MLRSRRHAPFLVAAAVVLLLALLPVAAAAQEAPAPTPPPPPTTVSPPPPSEREIALNGRAQVLRAEAGVVASEVVRLRAAVAAQEQRVAEAGVVADAAADAMVEARRARTEAARRVAEQRRRTKAMAASAYIRGPASVDMILRSATINDAVRRQSMAVAAGEATAKTLADLDRAEKAAARAEAEATDAAQAAASAAAAAAAQAEVLVDEQARQTLLLSAVSDRLEHTLAEAAALAEVDSAAAGAVGDRDAALRDVALPLLPAITGLRPSLPAVETARVGGIRVSVALAPHLQALLDAAAQVGFAFGGGGFRDPASQIALRVLHCGPTDYDIHDKPSGECVPPTARPGTSMHERGLAIDFTVAGRAIVSESDPAFQWLAANASTYGLFNLPGEPWHWSTTGS